jgi:hypothetical protein
MDTIDTKEPAGADKPAVPKGIWGTILTTTPIVLTVLATAFAGLSSSEMTQSMYYRSLAAQHQSKAGDQWAFFQAKRTRGTNKETTYQLLQSLAQIDDFDPAQVVSVCAQILQELDKSTEMSAREAAAKVRKVLDKLPALMAYEATVQGTPYLTTPNLPQVEARTLDNKGAADDIKAVVEAIRQRKTEAETAALVGKVKPADIEAATRLAEEDADRFDKACAPVTNMIREWRPVLAELLAAVKPVRSSMPAAAAPAERLNNSFQAAVLDFDARRYRQESDLNLRAAELYEVRVRRSGVESDRYRERSKHFFYAMLIAQAGVTIASLALARTQRSLLWLLAALVGVVALGFSAYVYLLF